LSTLLVAAPLPVAAQVPAAGAADAAAARPVAVGPVPAWVATTAPAALRADAAAYDMRLLDVQIRFDDAGMHLFQRTVARLNATEALAVLGRLNLGWDPAIETPTVHRVAILRDGKVIDVLASQSFEVLRREQNLESAVRDGRLTAFLQIADLRVGDEIEYIVSITSNNSLLAGHRELQQPVGGSDVSVGRLHFRAGWSDGRPMRWQAGPGLPPVRDGRTGANRWVDIDAANYRAPVVPAGAPNRFLYLNVMGFSDFADWQQVSALFAPVYAAAAVITPGSPLAAEADRIAAASTDPTRRAELALALVQGSVRYVADLRGLAGYQPLPAESVWRDRFGDCKGKTVLLLALLHRLGITAEPALVAVQRGDDALNTALPMPGRFDHVVVRATIGGKVHWLDGTRPGDPPLDRMMPPGFRWALPLTQPGSGLAELPPRLPPEPLEAESLVFEQPANLSSPATVKGSVVFRGDTATAMAIVVPLLGPALAKERAQQFWRDRRKGLNVTGGDIIVDRTTGEVRIEVSGTTDLGWSDDTPRSLEVPGSRMGINLTPKREAGPFATAPVALGTRYGRQETTLVLPRAGFTMAAEAIDTTVGGIRYVRSQTLDGNRLVIRQELLGVAREISLAEAKAADTATDKLYQKRVMVELPAKGADKAAAKAAPAAGEAAATDRPAPGRTADGKVAFSPPEVAMAQLSPAALALADTIQPPLLAGAFDEALAMVDAAGPEVPRDASWSVLKLLVLMQAGRSAAARQVLTPALAKAPRDTSLLRLQAMLLAQEDRLEDAQIPLDRAILVSPDDPSLYVQRGAVRERNKDYAGAAADYGVAATLAPDDTRLPALQVLALLEVDKPAALKAADAALVTAPDSATLHAVRGNVLAKLKQPAEAKAALARSIAIEPTSDAYSVRLREQLSDSPAAALDDAEALIRLKPQQALPREVAARLVAIPGGYDRIAAAYQAAHAKAPTDGNIIDAADMFNTAAGKPEATLAMLDTGLAIEPGNAQLLNSRCWLRATNRLDLDKALADCNAVLRIRPSAAAVIDSRGLIWLQKGDYAKALADYDLALAGDPLQGSSLYGRGLARMMLKQPGWEADIAKARKQDKSIDADYAGYKLPFALPPVARPAG
jgi:tetratricopeptide (TPR) repeat protein